MSNRDLIIDLVESLAGMACQHMGDSGGYISEDDLCLSSDEDCFNTLSGLGVIEDGMLINGVFNEGVIEGHLIKVGAISAKEKE